MVEPPKGRSPTPHVCVELNDEEKIHNNNNNNNNNNIQDEILQTLRNLQAKLQTFKT